MSFEPKILVLSMFSGENEFEACKAALAAQNYTHHELLTIENRPNLEAHHTLYRTIMTRSDEFDLFLKLDADMVFCDDGALGRVVQAFADHPETDQIIFAVRDFLPDKLSLGIHAFSNRVLWNLSDEALFVDPNPSYPGGKLVFWDDVKTIVDHAPDPLPYHALHFGLHRGLKAFQWGRWHAHPQAIGMWAALEATWAHFERTRDLRPGLAMMGAEMARVKRAGDEAAEKKSEVAQALFEAVQDMSANEIYEALQPFWGHKIYRRIYWYGLVYSRILPCGVFRRVRRLYRKEAIV